MGCQFRKNFTNLLKSLLLNISVKDDMPFSMKFPRKSNHQAVYLKLFNKYTLKLGNKTSHSKVNRRFRLWKTVLGARLCKWEIVQVKEQTYMLLII